VSWDFEGLCYGTPEGLGLDMLGAWWN